LLDGTYIIRDFQDAPIPRGFLIRPSDASFIVVNLKQACHWDVTSADAVFADSDNYYVISAKDAAYWSDSARWSHIARMRGYCVNGRTGCLRRGGDWENAGFLLMSLTDLREKYPLGTPRKKVTDQIGWGYDVNSNSNQASHAYFLQKEGECVIWFEDDKLKSIEKANWSRL
jgi:hypothetical protein